MYSAGAPKRIMLIHDATQEVPASALGLALHTFGLEQGDTLGLCGVFHLESKLKKLVSIDKKNPTRQSFNDLDVAKQKKQYENSSEIIQLSQLCESQKVGFSIEVASGPSRRALAVEAAIKLRATWVILDRKMKKDKTYFLKNLSCGISKMKQNNCIAQVRGPIVANGTIRAETAPQTTDCPEDDDDDLFSIELFPARNPASREEDHHHEEIPMSRHTRQFTQALTSPSPTDISDTSSECDYYISFTEAPRQMLKREISRHKYKISYNDMLC
uniref:Uncharacterized protein n=1 Tax=Kalanchoe fedtschenkoi TaxID=63787 RepID=A0A7N0RID7_KALFE